jgi:MFS family permease
MPDRIDRTRLFTGCVVALVATSFGFAVRAAILGHWRAEFNLSQEQIGYLLGAGLFPFAISIILFSLIIDRLGNGVSMAIAFTLHALSAVITLAAPLFLADPGAGPEAVLEGQRNGFALLYVGTFIFALGNGTIEAVINPVTATLYDREKTKYLNILHAGWPGGLVLGGLVPIAVSVVDPASVPGSLWQWQAGLVLVPTLAYGLMLFAAATFYGFGKTFFWPTTLGVVSEQYPRGGALMLNAIAGVGMISVGTIGNPAIGAVQDQALSAELRAADPALAQRLIVSRPGLFGKSYALDPTQRALLAEELAASAAQVQGSVPPELVGSHGSRRDALDAKARHQDLSRQSALLAALDSRTKQETLGRIALLPVIMLACYLALIAYFRKAGGYRAERLVVDAAGGVVRQF